GSRLRVSDLRRWTKSEEADDMVKQSDVYAFMMFVGFIGALAASRLYDNWLENRELPDIPVQSWDKYVEQQKKLGKEV
ncbi:hypothetical protein GCK32_003303, partial [Trichostrongylus colubriformis]